MCDGCHRGCCVSGELPASIVRDDDGSDFVSSFNTLQQSIEDAHASSIIDKSPRQRAGCLLSRLTLPLVPISTILGRVVGSAKRCGDGDSTGPAHHVASCHDIRIRYEYSLKAMKVELCDRRLAHQRTKGSRSHLGAVKEGRVDSGTRHPCKPRRRQGILIDPHKSA